MFEFAVFTMGVEDVYDFLQNPIKHPILTQSSPWGWGVPSDGVEWSNEVTSHRLQQWGWCVFHPRPM